MKNKLGNVKQVDLEFTTKEAWFRVRNTKKDLKCCNCKKEYEKDPYKDIVLATVEGSLNKHLCKECGEFFIKEGAQDIVKLRKIKMNKREKLIKQAERLGLRFWRKKASDMNVNDLEEAVAKHIKSERSKFKSFLESTYRSIVEEYVSELNTESYYKDNKITAFEVWSDPSEFLYDYDTDSDYDHHRWCSYFTATKKVGNKIFEYQWANANGDNSLEDAGFDYNYAWESMRVVESKDLITNDQIVDYITANDKTYLDKIKDKIVNSDK